MIRKPPRSLPKDSRNQHETSSDEAPPLESRDEHTRGGGHRSGSRGAGTLENSDGARERQGGPKAA